MRFIKQLALIAFAIIAFSACKKDEITTDADRLIGTYIGTTENYDTLSIDNKPAPTKYSSYIQAYVQRNKNAEMQILYFVNTNAYYNSTYHSGSGKTEGLLENIKITGENQFLIYENTVDFWGKPLTIKGEGTFDEASNSLILHLWNTNNGKTKDFTIRFVKQKTFNN